MRAFRKSQIAGAKRFIVSTVGTLTNNLRLPGAGPAGIDGTDGTDGADCPSDLILGRGTQAYDPAFRPAFRD
jgi:hypothetical protein